MKVKDQFHNMILRYWNKMNYKILKGATHDEPSIYIYACDGQQYYDNYLDIKC